MNIVGDIDSRVAEFDYINLSAATRHSYAPLLTYHEYVNFFPRRSHTGCPLTRGQIRLYIPNDVFIVDGCIFLRRKGTSRAAAPHRDVIRF